MAEDACPHCPHDLGEHRMAAPGSPLQGGIMFCSERGCACWSTWDVPQAEPEQPDCAICDSREHRPYQCPEREVFAIWLMEQRDDPAS